MLSNTFATGDVQLRAAALRPSARGVVRGTVACPARCEALIAKESRVGKMPVPVPKGVTVTIQDNKITAKGPKGELSWKFEDKMLISQEANGDLRFRRVDDSKKAFQLHGLSRTLASNLVTGVSSGFERKLQLIGVGYRASTEGTKKLIMALGLSHPVELPIPEGISVKVEKNTEITIAGADKYKVGQFAADVREWRKPEPYKGKGIRYLGEVITLKEGKKGK